MKYSLIKRFNMTSTLIGVQAATNRTCSVLEELASVRGQRGAEGQRTQHRPRWTQTASPRGNSASLSRLYRRAADARRLRTWAVGHHLVSWPPKSSSQEKAWFSTQLGALGWLLKQRLDCASLFIVKFTFSRSKSLKNWSLYNSNTNWESKNISSPYFNR